MNNPKGNHIEMHSSDFRIFEAVLGNHLLVNADPPRYTILSATPDYLEMTKKTKADLIGQPVFTAFPPNPANVDLSALNELEAAMEEVIQHRLAKKIPLYRHDTLDEHDQYHERHWKIGVSPIINDEGRVNYLSLTMDDITWKVQSEKLEEQMKPLKQAHDLFMEAPIAIQLLKGKDLIIAVANEQTLKILGKTNTIIGKRFLDVLPEFQHLGYEQIMREVMESKRAQVFYETPLHFNRLDKPALGYYNFVIQPYFEVKGNRKADGVLIFATEVTEPVIKKKKIIENEQKLDLAMEIAELGLFRVDYKEEHATYSQRVIDWFGYDQPEIPISEIFDAIYLEDRQEVKTTIEKSLAGELNGKHNLVYRVYNPKTGKLQYFHSAGQVQFENDEPTSINGIIRNVTEQVLSQIQIEESESKIRSIVDNAPFPIAVLMGKEMKIQIANETILKTWGKGNVIGQSYYDVLPEFGEQGIFEEVQAVYKSGNPLHKKHHRLDIVVQGKSEIFYFNYSFTPLFDKDGEIYGITITGADVTDLNLANRLVHESSQNLQNMILQAPVAMSILKGEDHRVAIANDLQLKIWGKEGVEVLDKPLFECVPEAKLPILQAALKQVYDTGEPYSANGLPVVLATNEKLEYIYLNVVYEPYRENDGIIAGVMCVATDVTEQVQSQQKIEEEVTLRTHELAEVNATLKQKNQELEQFAFIASHDLQEPLRKVSIFIKMLEKNLGEIDPQSKTYIDKILSSTNRMSQLIRDVLDFSQISTNRDKFKNINLNKVLTEIVSDFELRIEQRQAVVKLGEMPNIEAIPLQMQQLFSNLISNGLKFSREGEPPLMTINATPYPKELLHKHVGLLHHVKYYLIEVTDNGIGFGEEHAERIFGIFHRLHGKQEYAGTGIGLALCKKIAQNHYGDIWASSSKETGSVFYILLPEHQDIG